jgi:KUP system potassium uptake protein
VRESQRIKIEALPLGLFRVWAHYGFMERADVHDILVHCRAAGIRALDVDTTYYLGRLRLLPTGPAPMMRWRKRLYGLMARNASSAADFFRIPPDRVVEMGARVEF